MDLPQSQIRDRHTVVASVRTQYDRRLIGVPVGALRLRWSVDTTHPEASQLGYQIRVRRTGKGWEELDAVPSDSNDVIPAAPAPSARAVHGYAVRIATQYGWSAWSETTEVETGLDGSGLTALVIDIPSETGGPVPILRREFTLEESPDRAVLRISSLGVYDVHINGRRATDGHLNPGWNAYQSRVLLDSLDVTRFLRAGRNAIAITVADGWYRGRMGFAGRTEIYGDRIGAIAQLETGSGELILATDESWRGSFGPIRAAGIYDGSIVDLRLDVGSPSEAGFDDSGWVPARVVPTDTTVFEPRAVAPVRTVAEFPMTKSLRAGGVALDAGQNISGWVRLRVEGRTGDTVTIRHAEVLEPDGTLHTAALRTAKATDSYVLGRDGLTVLEPPFTFHGFRYAEVTGSAAVVDATAVAISSDLDARSTFECDVPALNRFHENVRWSQLDNFVSLPTDCPQRDERLGWTGDAQAFAATAATLFDTEAFWGSWLRDLDIEQTDSGGVPSIVPNIIGPLDMQMGGEPTDTMGRAGWADAATIVPLAVFQSYGSHDVLRAQLSSMRRWVAHLRRRAGTDVLLPRDPFQYGDWLDPDAPADRPWAAKVDSLFVANCFYAQSARLLARAEAELGEAAASEETACLAARVASSTWERWGSEAGDTQTGAAMCLAFDIVPQEQRDALARRLAAAVRAADGRIATGFLGTPLILDALSTTGHLAEAYMMLLRRKAPSWLYQVDRGATTVWERWDAIKEDGSIHRGEMDTSEGDSMISFNHYAYGAMIDWVYRHVAGLTPEEPGYRVVRVAPRPATALRYARASIATSFGQIKAQWRLDEGGDLRMELHVPFGVQAELDLPTTASSVVTVGGMSAPRRVGHGTHLLLVTSPAIVSVDDHDPAA